MTDRTPLDRPIRPGTLVSVILRLALVGLAAGLPACALPSKTTVAKLPSRHQVRAGLLTIRSDFDLAQNDPRVTELHELRREIGRVLRLPEQRRPVVVYLFQDEERYTKYMQASHPTLPARRAFFIGTPSELAVYAYWGDQVRVDLRHEYTHGLLHASLQQVPLWLDEGLAEYFEVVGNEPGRINQDHTGGLAEMLAHGWRPNLQRMEQLDDVSEMQRADYQEAWAWVHFLLNESPAGQDVLLDYLADLKSAAAAPSLAQRISREFPAAEDRLTAYLAAFTTDVGRAQVAVKSE